MYNVSSLRGIYQKYSNAKRCYCNEKATMDADFMREYGFVDGVCADLLWESYVSACRMVSVDRYAAQAVFKSMKRHERKAGIKHIHLRKTGIDSVRRFISF